MITEGGSSGLTAGAPRIKHAFPRKGGFMQAAAGILEEEEEEEGWDEIPTNFLCPISLEAMTDPVTLCTGQTYERRNIGKWLAAGNMTCPTTMQKLVDSSLIPNHTLRHVIEEWHRRQRLKALKREKKHLAPFNETTPFKETTPAEVRALLEDIVLCKGLEEIVLAKGQGVVMRDLNGQEVRVLSSPEYTDTLWKQVVDSSLHQELVDGLLHMDVKQGVKDNPAAAECANGSDYVSWLGGMAATNPAPTDAKAAHAGMMVSPDVEEWEKAGWLRATDAPQQTLVMGSMQSGHSGRRPAPSLRIQMGGEGFHRWQSKEQGAAEPLRVATGKGKVFAKSLQAGDATAKKGSSSSARWREAMVSKWNEFVGQAIWKGSSKAHKATSPSVGGRNGKQAVGSNDARNPTTSKMRKSLTIPPNRDSVTRSESEDTVFSPAHRRGLSSSIREHSRRQGPAGCDFASGKIAVDPFTWEDLETQQEAGSNFEWKKVHYSPPSKVGDTLPSSDAAESQEMVDRVSGSQQAASVCKWPSQRLVTNSRAAVPRHQEETKFFQQEQVVIDLLASRRRFADSLPPPDLMSMGGLSQESGSLSDFGKEISLYSPHKRASSHWQGFVSPELSGPLSGPISPLSVLEASACSETVSPYSRQASTSAGGASPLSGFTSPFPGLASPLSGPFSLSGPISDPISGPLSPFSVHSSQSLGSITPSYAMHDDYFPYGQDEVTLQKDFSKGSRVGCLIGGGHGGQPDDLVAASMFPALFSKQWESSLSAGTGGVCFPTLGKPGAKCSPSLRQMENLTLILDNDFLANPPPSPNKNFPSPVSRQTKVCPSRQDGFQAMRLEALKKVHQVAASEQIHRLGMVDETVPVLLTALTPFSQMGSIKNDQRDARECTGMVVKTLILLMPLTVRSAAQLTDQVVLDTLIEQMGEEASVGTRISVTALLGHIVETLADGMGSATDGDSLGTEVKTVAGGYTGALDESRWSPGFASAMLEPDHHRLPAISRTLDHKSLAQMITKIATSRSLLQRITRLLQTGRHNYQAAIASVSTLQLFCTHCSKALLLAICAGAIPALVDLLPLGPVQAEDRSTDQVGRILHLLELASSTEEGRHALVHHYRSLIPRLVSCLRPKSERRTGAALTVLSSIIGSHEAGRNDKTSVAAVEAGAASKLVLLIQSGCSLAIKAKCTELLKFLSNKYASTTMFLYHNDLTQTL